ncbi:MAG: pantetheine-phosphate adenylyltransferase [Pseudomonadota bacterium]
MSKKIAVYPGTFDPITIGHLDVILRARKICDELIIASATHHSKMPFFTPDQRVALINAALGEEDKTGLCPAYAVSFDGLLVDFAKQKNAKIIIRGLRTVSDFDYEFQMVGVNRHLDPQIDTIFLPADMTTQFISSSLAKQLFKHGGDLSKFVPENVVELMKIFAAENA